jgi:hypothetical protein
MMDRRMPQFEGLRHRFLTAGVIGAAACVIGVFFNSAQFFQSYLIAYLFWLGVALGCLPLLMLHHLVGGVWGFVIRRIVESGIRTLPVMALLFLPIVFGLHHLYEWSHPEAVAADPALQHKSLYLNVPFFLVRAAIYFSAWLVFAYFLNRWSVEQDRTGRPDLSRSFQLLSAPGILVYVLTMTFAAFDWTMSLEPHWFSTIFGLMVVAAQVLSTLAFVIIVAALLARETSYDFFGRDLFHDLGNLLLAFLMLWAYMSFSQYLIIWSGNLPEEISWYLQRATHGWQWVAAALAVFHFAVPFVLLLARGNKRKRSVIAWIAIWVLIMRVVDVYWLVAPTFRPVVYPHWLDVAALAAVGGVWLTVFFFELSRQTVVPLRDPNFQVERAA